MQDRLMVVETGVVPNYNTAYFVFKDKETGIQYLYVGGALTPLLGKDGKPIIEKKVKRIED